MTLLPPSRAILILHVGVAPRSGAQQEIHFMPSYTTADIRNVLITGHGGCGKTTLVDALLFASGTLKHKGAVADGSSASDFEKEEKEHKHSIYPAILHADYNGKRINLIDVPGSPD